MRYCVGGQRAGGAAAGGARTWQGTVGAGGMMEVWEGGGRGEGHQITGPCTATNAIKNLTVSAWPSLSAAVAVADAPVDEPRWMPPVSPPSKKPGTVRATNVGQLVRLSLAERILVWLCLYHDYATDHGQRPLPRERYTIRQLQVEYREIDPRVPMGRRNPWGTL